MANNLTGVYEAVFEVSIRQINGLLANLHQSGVSADAPMPLLHSASFRLGDLPRRPPIDFPIGFGDFGAWVLEYQTARGPVGLADLRKHLTGSAPPGAAKAIDELFAAFAVSKQPPPPPLETVRGRVRVQISTLTLSLPNGSSSEVSMHAFPCPVFARSWRHRPAKAGARRSAGHL